MTAVQIGADLGISRNSVLAKVRRLGLKGRGDETRQERLDRMIDIIADAPLGAPVSVKDAARMVGVAYIVAAGHWRRVWTALGVHPLDVGDELVERRS
jgi:hypothetical protein